MGSNFAPFTTLGLAKRHGIEIPFTEPMELILNEGEDPREGIRELVLRGKGTSANRAPIYSSWRSSSALVRRIRLLCAFRHSAPVDNRNGECE